MSGIDRSATMTTNSAPSPNVTSASTELGAGNEAFRAFDKADSQWITNSVTTGTITYDFGSGNTWKSDEYRLEPQSTTRMCKNWTFEGSNTGAFGGEQTVLDTQTNQTTWTTGVKVTYTFSNTTAYRYYRLNVTANNGDATYLEIDEVNIYAPNNESSSVSASLSPSASESKSASKSASASESKSESNSLSPSGSQSPSSSLSQSSSESKSLSPSGSESSSGSQSASPSLSPSASESESPSASISPSPAEYTNKYSITGNTYTDKYTSTL